jgi:hypothetical protein
MKKMSNMLCAVSLAVATPVLAASAPESSGFSPVVIAFFAFFGVLLVLQLVPGVVLLFSMLKELVSSDKKKAVAAVTGQSDKD